MRLTKQNPASCSRQLGKAAHHTVTCGVAKFSYANKMREAVTQTNASAIRDQRNLSVDEERLHPTKLYPSSFSIPSCNYLSPSLFLEPEPATKSTTNESVMKDMLEKIRQGQLLHINSYQLASKIIATAPASSFFCPDQNQRSASNANSIGVVIDSLQHALWNRCSNNNIVSMALANINKNAQSTTTNNNTDEDDECWLDEDEWTESTASSSISSACFLHEKSSSDQLIDNESETRNLKSLSSSLVSHPANCSFVTGTTNAATNDHSPLNVSVSSLELPRVQVRPGVTAVFLGAHETWNCICGRQGTEDAAVDAYDQYKFVHCSTIGCRTELCCVREAQYVLCPECCQVSQTNDDTVKQHQQPEETCETTALIVAGLGFTFRDVCNWEQQKRSQSH